MLEMGVDPQVASASSACMILFTSFTATTSFYIFDLLVYDYALWLFLIGFAFTSIGQVRNGAGVGGGGACENKKRKQLLHQASAHTRDVTYLPVTTHPQTHRAQFGLTYLMRKYNRNSYIIFSIAAVVGLSAVLMGLQSVISLMWGKGSSGGGGSICDAAA